MQSLWLCWTLCVLPLAGPGAAVTEEQVLSSLLKQLQLSQAPVLDRVDVEGMAIPTHVSSQYVALLQGSHADRSRGKRFSQNFRGELFLLSLVFRQSRPTIPTLAMWTLCVCVEGFKHVLRTLKARRWYLRLE